MNSTKNSLTGPLVSGNSNIVLDLVPDEEVWYRVLSHKDYVGKDGVHYTALRSGAIKPPRLNRIWDHEMSGRLRSLSHDVHAEAECHVADRRARQMSERGSVSSKIQFVGVGYASVETLRAISSADIAVDVILTPKIPDDPAHADVVYFGSASSDRKALADKLQDALKFLPPERVNQMRCVDTKSSTTASLFAAGKRVVSS